MTYLSLVLLATLSTLSSVATAEEGDRSDRRAEMRQRILDEFDADGDGEMSDEERATAREQMRERRGDRGNRERPKARKGKKGEKGDRGSARKGQGRRGPGGPPDPEALFERFDADGDGQLSRAEFMELTQEMRSHRERRGPRPGGRDRSDARPPRPEGPPPPRGPESEARRPRFDRERPLSNPDDRRGPREGARRDGAERRRPPSPEAVFERFDENDDDQLSREEFMKLAEEMRQRHHRRGGPGGDRPAMRDGRGSRRGPEGGPPRRPRPESDASIEVLPTDDSTV